MVKVWMLILCLFSVSAYSQEFAHIRLNPQFEEYLTRPKMKSVGAKSLSAASVNKQTQLMADKFKNSLLGVSTNTSTNKSNWTSPIPVDGDESLLYEEIRRQLEGSHREIGLGNVRQIQLVNNQFSLGAQNFSGFSWQKPFGVVQVYADRQVTPNLFGRNWLIQDTFNFEIEASTFLEKLNESGLSNMSATEIGAFAGITFRRVFTYYHYANSYEEGLSADFSKLFLSFTMFNQHGMERMNDEEILKREDTWSLRAGGLISTPPLYNVSFSAGVLAELSFQQTTSLQSVHTPEESENRYRLAVISKKSRDIGATLSLQLDFFKLLQLSLLSYDLTYQYASEKEFTLGVSEPQWNTVKNDPAKGNEWRKILKGWGEIRELEPYVVRLDESESSAVQSRGSILIWGKMQKTKTEQVRVIKDDMVRVFFKSYSQSVKVVQNIFSRLFSAVVYKILKFPIGATNAAIYNRQLTMEYDATHPQAADLAIARIDSAEKFSFVLTQSYDASKTHRWIDTRIKNDIIWFVDSFTTLPKDYKSIIRSEQLRGPLRVESNLRVEKAGFEFFLHLSDNFVFQKMAEVCSSKKIQDWIDESKRSKMLSRNQYGSEDCVKDMGHKFISVKKDYYDNALKPSLVRFKEFISSYYKKAEDIRYLVDLFGEENTFIHGKLQATTSQGASFVTSFSTGQFRGLGVIDNFKRESLTRAPASIISE